MGNKSKNNINGYESKKEYIDSLESPFQLSIEKIKERKERGELLLNYLQNYSQLGVNNKDWLDLEDELDGKDIQFFKLNEITFEEKAPRREALENILGTFKGIKGMSFVYMIIGSKTKVDFYFGIAKDLAYQSRPDFSIKDIAKYMLQPAINGNFRGSRIEPVSKEQKEEIFNYLDKTPYVGILEGVPMIDKELAMKEKDNSFQGVDRMIDIMFGEEFAYIIIAKPYAQSDVQRLEQDIYQVYNELAPITKYSLNGVISEQYSEQNNRSYADNWQLSNSSQRNKSTVKSKSCVTGDDSKNDTNNSFFLQYSDTGSWSAGKNDSWNCNNVKSGETYSNSDGDGYSYSENKSFNGTTNKGINKSISEGKFLNLSLNKTIQYTESSQNTSSENITRNINKQKGDSNSESISSQEQMEVAHKEAIEWLKFIDETLLPRLDKGRGKGIYLTCGLLFANNRATLHLLGNAAVSLYIGPKCNKNPLAFRELSNKKADLLCIKALKSFQIPISKQDNALDSSKMSVLSRHEMADKEFGGNWLSSEELAILAGVPQKEVIGLSLREEVEFGLNLSEPGDEKNRIHLGHLVQAGNRRDVPVYLDKKNLDKHTFIAGVTGSGKTTTCQNILLDCNLPFLVIEPAKTEYRVLKDKVKDIIYFTPGRNDIAPFFFNPFEIFPGEAITSRVDMLKATMEASFHMEAAIPQILEAAMYRAYEKKGWDIGSNSWRGKSEKDSDGPFSPGVYAFPTLDDFLNTIKEVTDEQGFDERLKNDYLGSLRARVQGLMVGAKGMMFNTLRSVDFKDLVNRKVVIELEEIKNGVEKSLLMGFILTNLLEAVKVMHRENSSFQHITLIEEAHRLLSRYIPGDSPNKKQGVEVFSDMLAEVRKYGESLIIVDQIPEKMTPEVLKNTNTKIIHKLFAKDDKEAIGSTIALDQSQQQFLSNLEVGRAIVFTKDWPKAVQVEVLQKENTSSDEIDPKEIFEIAKKYYLETNKKGVLVGTHKIKKATLEDIEEYFIFISRNSVLKTFKKIVKAQRIREDINQFKREIKGLLRYIKKKNLVEFMYQNIFVEENALFRETIEEMVNLAEKDENELYDYLPKASERMTNKRYFR